MKMLSKYNVRQEINFMQYSTFRSTYVINLDEIVFLSTHYNYDQIWLVTARVLLIGIAMWWVSRPNTVTDG